LVTVQIYLGIKKSTILERQDSKPLDESNRFRNDKLPTTSPVYQSCDADRQPAGEREFPT
jgi:hypothetical protein